MQKQTKDKLKKAVPLALGSSMMILSMLPAAAAFAATNNYISNVQTHVNGKTVSATSNHGHLNVWYQFRVTAPNGHMWIQRRFAKSPSMTWVPPGSGTYHVEAFALTQWQVAHKQWNKAVAGTKATDTKAAQVASISISGAPSANVRENTAVTLSVVAKDSSGNVISNPGTPTWSLPSGTTGATVQTLATGGAVFDATAAGTYTVTASLDGQTATAKIVVYGLPASVKLTPASSTISADGSSQETVTATVVDSNGNTVADYNGQITVTDSTDHLLGNAGLTTQEPVTISNGVGTFTIQAGTTIGAVQTLTPSALTNAPSGVNISYSNTSVTQTQPQATQVALAFPNGAPTYLGSNFGNIPTTILYSLADTGGYSTPSMTGEYVTYTISGPGSFDPNSVVTKETLWTYGTPQSLQVYGEQGQSGTITVTASGTGVQGQLQIPLYVNTAPASLSITSKNETGANGNPYTLYTAELLDTNGHPIFGNTDGITVTDNAAAPGQIEYGTISSSGSFVSGTAPTVLDNGQVQFAVRTVHAGTSPVTITVADPTENFTATAAYNYTPNGASTVQLTPSSSISNYTVKPGQSATYTAQITDSQGNPVAEAGQTVTFSFVGNAAGATFPNGLATGTYTATTNSQGVASVNVTVPAGASTGTMFTVGAEYGSGGVVPGGQTTVVGASSYGTQIAIAGTPNTAVGAGQTVTGVTATLENADGNSAYSALTNSTLLVTTSNPNVVAVNGASNAPTEEHLTASQAAAGIPNLVAGQAGTATITVQDLSDPSMPKASFTVSVTPGQATATPYVEYQGKQVTANNPLSVTANTPVALSIVNVDQGGNPIPVTGTTALPVSLSAPSGGHFRLTPNGASVNDVEIQPGTSSVTVYYVQGTTGAVSNLQAADDVPGLSAFNSPYSFTPGSSGTVTLDMGDSFGNTDNTFTGPVSVTLTTSPTETGSFNGQTLSSGTATATVDFTDGVATFPVTLNTAASGEVLTFSATGYGHISTFPVSISGLVSSAPSVSSATEVASGVSLSWGSVSGAATYQVLEEKSGASTFTAVPSADGGVVSGTSTTVSGLTTGASYKFEVEGVDQYSNVGPASSATSSVTWGATAAASVTTVSGFTAPTSTTTGTVTVTLTYDNAMSAANAASSDFSLTDTVNTSTVTGATSVSVSGDVVTLTFTLPSASTPDASGDAFTVTSSGLMDANNAPATTDSTGTL
ncbi:MAG: hypothetical protein M0Z36_12115 [Thermaerobacter sp.]|nr:hypothetical protein [Thermaerobacter sp.]